MFYKVLTHTSDFPVQLTTKYHGGSPCRWQRFTQKYKPGALIDFPK